MRMRTRKKQFLKSYSKLELSQKNQSLKNLVSKRSRKNIREDPYQILNALFIPEDIISRKKNFRKIRGNRSQEDFQLSSSIKKNSSILKK